jgi:integrase
VLSYQEEERLAAALCNRRNKAIAPVVWFAIETTMRRDELLVTSTWSDVNWEMSTITLYDAKSGGRDVPLTPAALAFLRALPQGGPAKRIFDVSKEALRAGWKRACKEAGIVGLRIHDLRHTGATRHARRLGGNIFLLQLVTGHKTLSQLARYVNVSTDDAVEALRQTEPTAPPPALAQMVSGTTGAAASQPDPADSAPAAEAAASNVVVGPWTKRAA